MLVHQVLQVVDFLVLKVHPPRRLEVARQACNRLVSRGKFVHVVLHLHKGRSKVSGSGEVVERDSTRLKELKKTCFLKSSSTEIMIHLLS